jgi:DNA repair protein RadA/Sms
MVPEPLGRPGEASPGRLPLGFGEVDRVLGGGLVPGSLVLLGGAPGVGKSTLLLQLAARIQQSGRDVLYVSGEESREQVRLRARRLESGAADVVFVASTDTESVIRASETIGPAVLCVDSIQTATSARLPSAAGSVAQVRECGALLQEYAKQAGVATVLVGHITKGGVLAGPRTLEHMVDVVLHFEGPRSAEHRLLRSSKNRFGSIEEVAAFEMTEGGLRPVDDPSALFVTDRPEGVSGSAVGVPIQGTRPLLAEVQALSARARFSSPQRICTGFAPRRLAILLAVLERRAGLPLGEADVFVNVVGGLRLSDPATDLAVVAALVSAERDRAVPPATAFIGEVGLGGELRGVSHVEARVRVARGAGIRTVVLPEVHRTSLPDLAGARWVAHVREVARTLEDA